MQQQKSWNRRKKLGCLHIFTEIYIHFYQLCTWINNSQNDVFI